jgi:hypothetical protein
MKIYHYNPETRELLGCSEAAMDPLETRAQGKTVYLVPASAVMLEPPEAEEGKARAFINGEWVLIDDNRGKKIYNTSDAAETVHEALGAIPEGFTSMVPCDYPRWDGEKWVEDQDKKKEAENAVVKARLEDVDLKSIRSIREWIVTQPDAPAYLKDYESQAVAERAKLAGSD